MGRELVVQAILERDLTRTGAHIEYVLGGGTDTPESELLKMMKGAFAVYDNRQRVEKSRRGKRGKAKAGHVVGSGPRLFGFDYPREAHAGTLTINESQALAVRMIFDWLIDERLSTYAITRRLWEQRVPHRDGEVDWTPAMVQKLLKHPAYKGRWPYGRTRRTKVDGKVRHVPVPEDQWIYVDVPEL